MSQYRLVCIYETYKSPTRIELRIEVCLGSNTKSMSPFIRRVDMEELFYTCVHESQWNQTLRLRYTGIE